MKASQLLESCCQDAYTLLVSVQPGQSSRALLGPTNNGAALPCSPGSCRSHACHHAAVRLARRPPLQQGGPPVVAAQIIRGVPGAHGRLALPGSLGGGERRGDTTHNPAGGWRPSLPTGTLQAAESTVPWLHMHAVPPQPQ